MRFIQHSGGCFWRSTASGWALGRHRLCQADASWQSCASHGCAARCTQKKEPRRAPNSFARLIAEKREATEVYLNKCNLHARVNPWCFDVRLGLGQTPCQNSGTVWGWMPLVFNLVGNFRCWLSFFSSIEV